MCFPLQLLVRQPPNSNVGLHRVLFPEKSLEVARFFSTTVKKDRERRPVVSNSRRLCRTDFAPFWNCTIRGCGEVGLPDVASRRLRRRGEVWRRGESNPLPIRLINGCSPRLRGKKSVNLSQRLAEHLRNHLTMTHTIHTQVRLVVPKNFSRALANYSVALSRSGAEGSTPMRCSTSARGSPHKRFSFFDPPTSIETIRPELSAIGAPLAPE